MSLVLFSLFPLGIDALMPFILPIISFFYLLILKIWYFDIFVCLNVVYFVLVLWLLLFLHACKTNSWFSATWTRYLGLCLRSGIWFGCLDALFWTKRWRILFKLLHQTLVIQILVNFAVIPTVYLLVHASSYHFLSSELTCK